VNALRCSLALCAVALAACPSSTDRDSKPAATSGVTGIPASPTTAADAGGSNATPSTTGSATDGNLPATTIETNTQATFGDVRIGVGNIWDEEYTDPEGKKHRGLTAGLWVFERDPPKDFKLRAHPGEKFIASKSTFEVVRVTQTSVELRISTAP